MGLYCLVSVAAAAPRFTLPQVLDYPHVSQLTSARAGNAIAWIRNLDGVRNVWVARAPLWVPQRVSRYTDDDGQEITQLAFSPEGGHLVYVVGGDHSSDWPAAGDLAPDPDSVPVEPVVSVWSIPTVGGIPRLIAEGDGPVVSVRGAVAYIKAGQVWTSGLDGQGAPAPLFFDRGKDSDLAWSPDGSSLAFVSHRDYHALIGIYRGAHRPLLYLAPSIDDDSSPVWSPGGARVAFVRNTATGGAPFPFLKPEPRPWSIWIANVRDGRGHAIWDSPDTPSGSFPEIRGGPDLLWVAGGRLVFLAYLDDWPHLYSLPASGGSARLLTPGSFMVEHIAPSPDGRFILYDANAGATPGDQDRRHLFMVSVTGTDPVELTSGKTLELSAVNVGDDHVAYVRTSAQDPTQVFLMRLKDRKTRVIGVADIPPDFPADELVVPRPVTFRAADGLLIHGQLFTSGDHLTRAGRRNPAVIFLHGGPSRQMLLGWHDLQYYDNAYAVNQYLAADGFLVLSVNYRLGVGYGRKFHEPLHAGAAGAAEYQDVVAAAKFLMGRADVDSSRIGIWGGSYGGYLTAIALARNSDIFKAGVDIHGVHDWTLMPGRLAATPSRPYEANDREEALRIAWESSPVSMVSTWKSPVLLIQGDDDRNVPFQQTVDLAYRLRLRHIPMQQLVIPNEIHDFLRQRTWLLVDTATIRFLEQRLKSER
jgi:dipeptidyl aminopeptidase/acylaminoacyl peptidase